MSALRLLALPIGFVLAATAIANVVSVSRKQLSVGASFDVAGTEFRKRPNVWLDLDGRRIPLRIAKGATDTLLHATLTAIPSRAHGSCLLKVRPRGAKVAFALAGLSIELPHVDSATPASGAAGTDVTIDGSFFGAKRGRVDFGGRRGRIVSWTDSEIHALVPAGLQPGVAAVVVTSKAGASLEPIAVTIGQ